MIDANYEKHMTINSYVLHHITTLRLGLVYFKYASIIEYIIIR